jgi:hypothetical protein
LRYSYLQAPAEKTGTQVGSCMISDGVCKPYSLDSVLQRSARAGASGGAANNVGELAFNLNGRYNHQPDFWKPDKSIWDRACVRLFSYADSGFWQSCWATARAAFARDTRWSSITLARRR